MPEDRAERQRKIRDAQEDVELQKRQARNQKIIEALPRLPQRAREVLTLRYGGEYTLREIGEHFNLSGERIRQIEEQALAIIRGERPAWKSGYKSSLCQTIAALTDGESVTLPLNGRLHTSFRALIYASAKRVGIPITIRTVMKDGQKAIRIWRIE